MFARRVGMSDPAKFKRRPVQPGAYFCGSVVAQIRVGMSLVRVQLLLDAVLT